MNAFGFMVGTVLVNTLFLFDVFVTKYQQRWSLWGSTMTLIVENYNVFLITPLWTLISLWFLGLIYGNSVDLIQVIVSIVFWVYLFALYSFSTAKYYEWKVPQMKKDRE